MELNKIIKGNAFDLIKEVPDESIHLFITSSPYYLQRYYGTEPIILGGDPKCDHSFQMKKGYRMSPDSTLKGRGFESEYGICGCGAYYGEFGLEPDSEDFINHYLVLLREVVRTLKPEGTMWIEIADKYGGGGYGKPTSKTFIPERLAIKLTFDLGLYCRNDIILYRSSRPESLQTRFSRKHAHLYLFTKKPSSKHYFDLDSVKTKGSVGHPVNPGDVWEISAGKVKGSNTASFSIDMLERVILSGSPKGGIVLDTFMGVGHSAYVAKVLGRQYLGFELLEENYQKSLKVMKSLDEFLI